VSKNGRALDVCVCRKLVAGSGVAYERGAAFVGHVQVAGDGEVLHGGGRIEVDEPLAEGRAAAQIQAAKRQAAPDHGRAAEVEAALHVASALRPADVADVSVADVGLKAGA